MSRDPVIDRILAAAERVKALRAELAQAEAELAHVSNATTTRGAPPLLPPPPPPALGLGLRDKIRHVIKNGKPWSTEQIARQLGLAQDVIGDAMRKMRDLKRMRPGIYRLKKT